MLSVGQTLYIAKPETAVTDDEDIKYVVKKGDTLYKISNEYGVSVDDIIKLNNLNSDALIIGQELIIKKSPLDDDSANIYTVKAGDNLYAISKNYNVSIDKIKQANGLTSNILTIGQKLKIPSMDNQYDIYVVKPGDTLYSIARLYDTNVTNIQTINNLSTSILSVGQQLLVPKK